MTAISSLRISLRQNSRRENASPEITLVYGVKKNALVGPLKFGKREHLWQEMEGDVRVAEFRSQADQGIIEHCLVGVIVESDLCNRFPRSIRRGQSIVLRLQQRKVADDYLTFSLVGRTERIELFHVFLIGVEQLTHDTASGGVERFFRLRNVGGKRNVRFSHEIDFEIAYMQSEEYDADDQARCTGRFPWPGVTMSCIHGTGHLRGGEIAEDD